MSDNEKRWIIGAFMMTVIVISIVPFMINKYITKPYVDGQDDKVMKFVEETNIESLRRIENKLDTLIENKNGSNREKNKLYH